MDQPFVDYLVSKLRDFDGDKEMMIFKITMEIHSCHEKLKHGLRSEEVPTGPHMLLDYYKKLAGPSVSVLKKCDTVFLDAWDIVRVYSVQLDETFPLIEYPYKLFHFHLKNLAKNDNDALLEQIKKQAKPTKNKEFVKFYSNLTKLSPDVQKKLMIHSFFIE